MIADEVMTRFKAEKKILRQHFFKAEAVRERQVLLLPGIVVDKEHTRSNRQVGDRFFFRQKREKSLETEDIDIGSPAVRAFLCFDGEARKLDVHRTHEVFVSDCVADIDPVKQMIGQILLRGELIPPRDS